MNFPKLVSRHPLSFDYEDGLVRTNRDNAITAIVAATIRRHPELCDTGTDNIDNEIELLLPEATTWVHKHIELTRTHDGMQLSDSAQLERLLHYKIRKALQKKHKIFTEGQKRGSRAPEAGVFPDRWWPTYPPNQLPLKWAEDLLNDTLDKFFAEIPAFNSVGVNSMTAQDLLACTAPAGPWVPPRLLLAASPSLGKTRGALERLADRFKKAWAADGDNYVRMNIVYACPTVELAKQNAETYRSFGGRCTVSLGRDYNFDKDPENTPCKIPNVVRAVQRAGIAGGIQTSLCRRRDPETGVTHFCEHFNDCAYQQQFDPTADVHFVAHSHLTHVMSEAHYGRIELLIIDESFLNHQTTKKKLIPPHALVRDPYGQMVVESMSKGINPWHAFRDAGITVGMIEDRIATLVALDEKAQPPVYPNINAKQVLKAFDPDKGWKSDPVISVLRRVRDEYKVAREGDEPIRSLAYNPEHPVADKAGTPTVAPMLYLQFRSSFKMLRKDMPVLVLDATGHSTALAELHIPDITFRRIEVERKATVLQATGFTGSMTKMQGDDAQYRDEAMHVAARFAETHPKMLIGTTKGAVEKGITPPNASSAVAHFGGIRGLNKYEGFDAVLIAGRMMPRSQDLENTARALLYDDPRPLNLTGGYGMRQSGYFMQCSIEDWESYGQAVQGGREWRPGRKGVQKPESWGVTVKCHDDPFIEAIRFQITEAEIIQMIDRPRWARRSSYGLIILLTEIPIDGVPVDVLMPYNELVGRDRPGVRLRIAYEMLGALPPPDMLLPLAEGLWPSVESIKFEMQAVKDVPTLLHAQRWYFQIRGRRGRPSCIYAVARELAADFLAKHCPEAVLADSPEPELI
ncbi:hypothetical protein [Mesorhizobium shangrilense]|uniref:Uncharacterized protein n=1 Tax=Mesorhizobium shangrilense TaxID=460060 RepID=A0ABV2DBW6_9HYPH